MSGQQCLLVAVTPVAATYQLLDGSSLNIWHYGEEIALTTGMSVTRAIPPVQAGPRPTQPPGRVPARRK